MARARWRLPWAAASLTTAAAGVAIVALELGLGVTSSPGRLLAAALAALTVAAALGYAAGAWLSRRLQQLRGALVQRERTGGSWLDAGLLREIASLTQAAELIATEESDRTGELQRQSAELASLVASASEGLLHIGRNGRIEFLNPAAAALLGLPAAARGQRLEALVRSRELRQLVESALRGERVPGTELAAGDRRVLVSAQPVAGGPGDGNPGGIVVAVSDLTQLRRLEGVRRDFVANVSHELKTPLTSIRGYADTLLADSPPPELQRQFLEVIQRNAARLQRIVEELLDLSMIESGGWRPQLQEVAVTPLVNDAWQACLEAASTRRIEFRPPAGAVRVLADPVALRQVLANLFDNAIRHTAEGGYVQVTATAPQEGGPVRLEVADNGSGIPGDALPRIFERFYRVDPARSRAAGGTGLGLAIVKHIIEAMGGEVQAESVLGRGTTIRFTLPAPPRGS